MMWRSEVVIVMLRWVRGRQGAQILVLKAHYMQPVGITGCAAHPSGWACRETQNCIIPPILAHVVQRACRWRTEVPHSWVAITARFDRGWSNS